MGNGLDTPITWRWVLIIGSVWLFGSLLQHWIEVYQVPFWPDQSVLFTALILTGWGISEIRKRRRTTR